MEEIDAIDLSGLELRLLRSAKKLASMSADIANAKTVVEYSADRRKRILSVGMAPHLKAGESSVKSESLARASEAHHKQLEEQMAQDRAAQEIIEEYKAEQCKWETCRTLISLHKQLAGNL